MTQRRPDTYIGVNTNTQRTGLPSQNHKILLLSSEDMADDAPASKTPQSVYDPKGADEAVGVEAGKTSVASRMVATTLKVSQGVDVSVGKQ